MDPSCATALLTIQDTLATITLTPATEGKPPTMEYGFFDSLDTAIGEIESTATVRAVVVRSAHRSVFCAGGDIKMLDTLDGSSMARWIDRGHDTLDRLESLQIPVLAYIDGYAMGGGLELALACDLIYASENARLGQTEATLGFIAGWGGSFRLLRRVGLGRAKEMFFTGELLDAKRAAQIGLADFSGTRDETEKRLTEVVDSICACSADSVSSMKKILFDLSSVREVGRILERDRSVEIVETAETKRRVREFIESRRRR